MSLGTPRAALLFFVGARFIVPALPKLPVERCYLRFRVFRPRVTAS
jgi:hypothetical protein